MSSQTLRNDLRLTPSPPPPPPPPRLSSTTATAVLPTVRKPTRPLPPGSSKKPEATAQSKESATKPLPLPPRQIMSITAAMDPPRPPLPSLSFSIPPYKGNCADCCIHGWHMPRTSSITTQTPIRTSPPTPPPYTPTPIMDLRAASQRSTSPKPPPPKSRPKSSVIIPHRRRSPSHRRPLIEFSRQILVILSIDITSLEEMWSMCVLAVVLQGCQSQNLDNPVIDTLQGRAMGWERLSRDGRVYQAWSSIPYAQPPLGELRFKPSKLAEKWTGTLNATVDPPMCLQPTTEMDAVIGTEDCLYINVHRPKDFRRNRALPVLLGIYGGFFERKYCGPHEVADYLMDEDVMFVAFNYRMNFFGK
ncbi:hypothetical protein GE061_009669 [Apolygus lucorum]|uniref:Carboxylesterase type B domain-containing protein n=1 Tax=Apolygus lucorum TaxID=248454 RepID=A0A8S9Y273_APOLU|nr:hypothetical protein GE061_009669 [Apolygus lucorum]